MEGGSQAKDHGQAISAKIRYSVSSTFATGCSATATATATATTTTTTTTTYMIKIMIMIMIIIIIIIITRITYLSITLAKFGLVAALQLSPVGRG